MKLLPLLILLSTAVQAQLITEILADPSPSRGLPEYEFLELYNPHTYSINLKGYRLSYGESIAVFPDYLLLPDTYVIVCRYNRAADFAPYGPVVPLPNFSLPNDGSTLLLKSPDGKRQDEVHYRNAWLKGKEGYSLERINLHWPCLQGSNWGPSSATQGGTPGKPNEQSPLLDLAPTRLLDKAWTDSTVLLTFSEALTPPKHALQLEGAEFRSLELPHPEVLKIRYVNRSGTGIKLSLLNLHDCLGRDIAPLHLEFSPYIAPALGDIFISEVAYHDPDYVEIKSAVPVQWQGWTLSRLRGEVEEKINLSPSYSLSAEYTVFTADTAALRAAFPDAAHLVQTTPFLRLPLDSATLVLRSPEGEEYDRIHYHEKLHAPLLSSTVGIALERDHYAPARWHSSPTGGSPGRENANPKPGKIGFWIEPEILDPRHGEALLMYNFPYTGLQAQLLLLNREGNILRTFPAPFTLGGTGQIPWDGRGEQGQTLPNGLYVLAAKVYGKELRHIFYTKIALFSP